jgi:hypothetical protein
MTLIQKSASAAFLGWGSFFVKPMAASFYEAPFGMKANFGRV